MEAKVKTWLYNIENGSIKNNTEIILNCIKKETEYGGIDTNSMREKLGIKHQTLTGRLSSIQDYGLIKVVDVIEHMNYWYSVYQFVEDEQERSYLMNQRQKEKVLNWLKQGIEKHDQLCTPLFKKQLIKNYNKIKNDEQGAKINLSLYFL